MSKEPKVVGGINLSTRLRSKSFWGATIPLVVTFVVSLLSLLGVPLAEDAVNQYTAIGGLIISILAQVGVIVDPNSKGVTDSPIAQTYTKPRDAYNPDEHVVFKNEVEQQPEEWVDGRAHEVNENVQGLRDVDQKEIEQEQANELPIGLGNDSNAEYTQTPNSIPQEENREVK